VRAVAPFPDVYIDPDGNRLGLEVEHSIRTATTLAQGLGAMPPPLWTEPFRQVAGSEEVQQFRGSSPIPGQVPDMSGKPEQN
jgi:hypothetical protein